jgi:Phytanoyl-CoA dioxygenase (PhyH)
MKRFLRWLLAPFFVLSIFTSAKCFRGNPILGSAALNRWGLHVARKRVAARIGRWRRRQLAGLVSAQDRAELERDGFIVKRNFLDDATFRALRDEIFALNVAAREAVIGDTLTRLIPLDAKTLPSVPVARRALEGRAYRNLLAYVGSFKRQPRMYVQTVFSLHCDGERDIQSFFHSDTFHPTLKSWLFLQDVAADEAAFTYVPGSHRYNRRRLAWERKVSINAAHASDALTAEGSLRISEREIKRLGYGPPLRLALPANTLVVADTSGFHARAVPPRPTVRVSIWAYSRSNPFLPWVGGDVEGLLRGRALRLAWAVMDTWARTRSKPQTWRFVGDRSPLGPPAS